MSLRFISPCKYAVLDVKFVLKKKCGGVDWINMAEFRDKSWDVVSMVMNFRVS